VDFQNGLLFVRFSCENVERMLTYLTDGSKLC